MFSRYTDSVAKSNNCMNLVFISEKLTDFVSQVEINQWTKDTTNNLSKGIQISIKIDIRIAYFLFDP